MVLDHLVYHEAIFRVLVVLFELGYCSTESVQDTIEPGYLACVRLQLPLVSVPDLVLRRGQRVLRACVNLELFEVDFPGDMHTGI